MDSAQKLLIGSVVSGSAATWLSGEPTVGWLVMFAVFVVGAIATGIG